MDLAQRFWAKVAKTDTCWIWTGYENEWGYGVFKVGDRTWRVHRLSFELEYGPIPAGLDIDHLCKVRLCVRPTHLEAVTELDNVRRQVSHIDQCPHGHPYTEENTAWNRTRLRKDGVRGVQRVCRQCRR
jgi:hypothetical protein